MPLESEFYEACARKKKKMPQPNEHIHGDAEPSPIQVY